MMKHGSGTKKMRQRQKWEQADKQSERKTCRQTDRRDFPSINKNKQKKNPQDSESEGKKNPSTKRQRLRQRGWPQSFLRHLISWNWCLKL